MDRYAVFKETGTHADIMAAVGAADLLRHLDPRIVEHEDRFEVRLPRALREADLDAVDPGFSYLLRAREEVPNLPPERVAGPDTRMYSILGRLKAFRGPNLVVSRFAKMPREAWEGRIWDCLHGGQRFVFTSPLVQLFNPQSARGYSLLKPSGTSRRDKTKDRWGEPFKEWLRFRGYFEGSAGWFASGDLRLFCPVPTDIPYGQFVSIVAAFRELSLGGTAAKMDCRAVLGLTRLLVEHTGGSRRPNECVRGVSVAHYKDMGQAHTVMAMEYLAIPDWGELASTEQAQWWLRTLDEHDTALRRLTDSHSDEFALLKQYRRTFQARREESAAEFLEFLSGYGALLFHNRAVDHWVLPQFTFGGAEPILAADPQIAMAIANPGFLAIAAAIRRATIGAQAARGAGSANHREIRYGMFPAIRRAARSGRGELLRLLSSFVFELNRESKRRCARGLPSAQIQDGEMAQFASLLVRLPSRVAVGSLLNALACCVPGDRPVAEPQVERFEEAFG